MDELDIVIVTFATIAFVMHGLFAVVSGWQRERTLREAVKAGGGSVEALLHRPDVPSAGRLALSGALLLAVTAAFVGSALWRGEMFGDVLPLLLFALLPGCVYLGAAWLAARRKRRLGRRAEEVPGLSDHSASPDVEPERGGPRLGGQAAVGKRADPA